MDIQIHYTNKKETEMMVYLPSHNKTYFVSVDDYDRHLKIMRSPWINEIEKAIREFLKEK